MYSIDFRNLIRIGGKLLTARASSIFACAMAALAGPLPAMAAVPVSISFTQATEQAAQAGVPGAIWKVKAPTGSQLVVKATPDLYKQTKNITLKYSVYGAGGSGWQESIAPWPTALTLNASGVATVPLKFNISTQWGVQACYSWKPSGSNQKTDACTDVVFFEGVDPLKAGAEKLISFFFHPPSNVSAKASNAVAVKPSGQELKLRVAKDVLMRSTTKKFRLLWIPGGAASLPASEQQPPGQVAFSFTGDQKGGVAKIDMEGNDWGEITVPLDFGQHKKTQHWTLKACTEIDLSGEICSITRQIELVQTPVIKMSDQFKDPKIDPNQPLQPLAPPPSGGGGGGGEKASMMAPPPVLGAPAAGSAMPAASAPSGRPPSTLSAPVPLTGPADPGLSAMPQIPGCTALPGRSGEFSCTTPEAAAGCERLRVSPATGIRTCHAGGARLRR